MSNDFYKKIQGFIDFLIEKTILFFIPSWLTPNLLSWLRIFLIPLILFFIKINYWLGALIIFLIATLLDSLDGALARKRQQFSHEGLIIDPLADKLLIGLILLLIMFDYPFISLILSIIGLEALIIFLAFLKMKNNKEIPRPANVWGKIKMLLQSIGVLFILLWKIFKFNQFLLLSAINLWLSLVFLILSTLNFTWKKKLYNK